MASLRRNETRRQFLKSFEAKSLRSRSFLTQIADNLTEICGSTPFLIFHVIFFAVWIVINTGLIPQIQVFDPFPFGLLTMIVSLEAIFLAIVVLISQNREARIAELREEIDLQINIIAEEEISKMVNLLVHLLKKEGIHVEKDAELKRILGISNEEIEAQIEKELS